MIDLSPEAEALLKRARESYSPDEARIAGLRAAVEAKVGLSLASKGTIARAAGVGTTTKLAGVGVLVIASVVGAQMFGGQTHPSPTTPTEQTRGAPFTASVPAAPPSSLPREPTRDEVRSPSAPPSISVEDLPSAPPDPVAPGRKLAPAPAPHERAAAEERPAIPSRERDAVMESPAVVSTPPATGPAVVSTPPAPATGAASATLGGELSLLRAARLALDRGDAAAALAVLDRYAQTFPNGTLQEESLATRALTLCALQRVAAAKEVARRLESIAPRSPHLARVRASCAGDGSRP